MTRRELDPRAIELRRRGGATISNTAIAAIVTVVAGCCSERNAALPAQPGASVAVVVDTAPIEAEPTAPPALAEPGQQEFADYCAACHQPDGQGQEDGPPPLVGSPWVRGSEARLVRIVLHGLGGPIELGGVVYNLEMPAFGPLFSDDQIAAVLSHVRREYGAPSPAVDPSTVARIRAETADRYEYWTVAELETIP